MSDVYARLQALDIFGGDLPYAEVVRWQREQERTG